MTFPTTRWSLIVASGVSDDARTAWAELAANYRSAIHVYFRCRFGADAAEDLTSSFFTESIAGGWWARADLDRGSFRTYLRMLLHRFGARHVERIAPMQVADCDIDRVAGNDADPEAAYERDFAHTLVERALMRLRIEHANADYEALLPFLLDRGDQGDLKQLAVELGLAQNTLLQRLRRMRLRLRELLRDEFAQLVADPASIDAELLTIRKALTLTE
jgi:RNA polymerase sigma-70 factor (ECF subfamily)